jgi:serine protease Do
VVLVGTNRAVGSGFVVSNGNLILTNSHVIDGHDERGNKVIVMSVVCDKNGKVSTATIYANVTVLCDDPEKDMALLRVEDVTFKSLHLSDEEPETGERVVVIGNPTPAESTILINTLSEGIISSAARDIQGHTFIQTTASVNPGNSGGPLFNMKGEVIGMITLKAMGSENIGFAIPASELKKLVDQYSSKK